jgi:hypothetical protein
MTSPFPLEARLARITQALGGDAAVADALGANQAELRGGRAGQAPDPEHRDRVIGLDAVIALLSGSLEASSIPRWLHGSNAHLGGRRPVTLLKEGRISDVIAAIEALKSGAFA